MKVYVLTDLEGPAMTSTWEQVLDDAPREKERSEHFLTGDVNACVDGILDFDPAAQVIDERTVHFTENDVCKLPL